MFNTKVSVLTKLLTLILITLAIITMSKVSYAVKPTTNSTTTVNYTTTSNHTITSSNGFNFRDNSDLHIAFDVGVAMNAGSTYSKTDADKSKSSIGLHIAKKDQVKNNRKAGLYFNLQVGADIHNLIKSSMNTVITPYVELGEVTEFKGASPSVMLGTGLAMTIPMPTNEKYSYFAGADLHSATFTYRNVQANYLGAYGIKSKAGKIHYNGMGSTLSVGAYGNVFGSSTHKASVKLFYMMNRYSLNTINTGDKFTDKWLKSQFPQKINANSIGLSVGFKY